MLETIKRLLILSAAVALYGATSVQAHDATKIMGDYRVELHVLPPETFYTTKEVKDKQVKMGMLIEGGAAPVQLDAAMHPNHHLVVHIFNNKTGLAVADANVTLDFTPVDSNGKSSGESTVVPIVIMQAIGKGPESTHYGNNVVMAPGSYIVVASVNGHKATFKVSVSDARSNSVTGMHMH